MFGPIKGRQHDAFMLHMSDLIEELGKIEKPDGEPCAIYGLYRPSLWHTNILVPFKGNNLNADQKAFKRNMSHVRVSVEWGFGKISIFLFAWTLLQPVGKYYLVGTILINCHMHVWFSDQFIL